MRMYNLIVVDDEDFIRKYFCEALNWSGMGFDICGSFRNVNEAIEYVKKNKVDVVISDIRMTNKSGIYLAEYLYNNYPEIKIVFISGYKKFEYAQKAISYNVVDYLIKPLTYTKLHTTFEQLRVTLDKSRIIPSSELLKQLRRHFFTDLLMGVFINKVAIIEYVQKLGLNIDIDNELCCTGTIHLKNLDAFLNEHWLHGMERLHTAMYSMFQSEEAPLYLYIIDYRYDKLEFVATGSYGSVELFKTMLDKKLNDSEKNVNQLLSLECAYEMGLVSVGVEGVSAWCIKNGLEKDIPGRRRHLIISLLLSGNTDAARLLFNNTVLEFKDSKDMLKLFTSELESICNNDPEENLAAQDETIETRLNNVFERAALSLSGNNTKFHNKLIKKAMEYIAKNYSQDISLEDVAAYVALSPVYFSRYFKQETGEKFIDYVSNLKMEKAALLLRQTEYKIQDVCNMVGYRSSQHFSKLFRSYTGHTPASYRNNAGKE